VAAMVDLTCTVLIIDDSATDREQYRRYLLADSTRTHQLLEAELISTGLELYRLNAVDVILLDYVLPDGDGLDFLAKLPVQSNGRVPPVVMMTGQGNESIAVQAIQLGAEDYLIKRDLTPELLQLKVHRAIENACLRRQQQQQEQRFRASVENMLDCFGIYSAIRDATGRIVDFRFDYLNAAAMQGLRMTAADMDKTLCELFPAVRETGLFAEYCQVVETGIPLIKEDLVYTDVFAGELLTHAYTVQIAKIDDGFIASWRDITAKKQVELSLQSANQQITTIWESMTDAYVTLDRDWQIIYTNPAATEIYRQIAGLTPAEYLGKSHWEVFPRTVGTIVEEEYRRAVADRVAVNFEMFYEPTETWFEVHGYPSTEGFGIYFRDINQRKRDELARSAAERERDRFFNLSLDLLIVADFNGYFVRVNPACEKILGFTSAEIMAKPFLDFVHPDDLAATSAVAESLSTGGILDDFENRYRCKDGSYRWILWSAIPDAELSILYANGHDITDRKIAELNNRFLYELVQRLRLLSDAEAIQWEAVKSLGEYLDADRATWFEVDLERGLATIDRNWHQAELASHAGVYPLADFILPETLTALTAGHPVASSDVTTDPFTIAYLDNYQQVGVGAFVNIPCIEEGCWVAAVNVNTTAARIWREDEIELMQAVVTQLWSLVAQARSVAALRAQEHQTRAAQAIVKQQLGEIETIYQTAPVGLCFVDTDLRFVRLNERLAQINGLPVAAHIGRTLSEVLPSDDQLESLYRQVIESGEPILDLELSGINPTEPGVTLYYLVRYYPQKDTQGRVVGVNAMVQDITDRKRTEAALRASERMRRFMFEQTFELIGLVDLDGELLEVNQAALDSIAAQQSEIVGQKFWETPWWHTPQLQQQLIDAIDLAARGEVIRYEVQFFDGNGNVMITDFSLKPMFDEDGQIVKLIAEGRDITDSKRAQAALEERNQELDAFVYVVSHDLKAPLRAVYNLSQWIEDDLEGEMSADTQSQMTLLRSRVNRMAATIDGLLEYARCGRGEDAIETVEVAQLLADVIDSVAPPATFTINLPTELPTLLTKRLPLFQVFTNLVGNGIKHHHSEAGLIQVSIQDRGDWYEFAVADDGPGIDPEHQERMFKIFQAVNPQSRSDSTGIGLAIVKKIIEAEGGTIWLESEMGKGTAFYFTWPKHLEDPRTPPVKVNFRTA
jgi:PAS domain S-box-containing protein